MRDDTSLERKSLSPRKPGTIIVPGFYAVLVLQLRKCTVRKSEEKKSSPRDDVVIITTTYLILSRWIIIIYFIHIIIKKLKMYLCINLINV